MLPWPPPHLCGNCDLDTVIGKTGDCASITGEPFPRGGEPVRLEEETPCETRCPDDDSCPKVVPLPNLFSYFHVLSVLGMGGWDRIHTELNWSWQCQNNIARVPTPVRMWIWTKNSYFHLLKNAKLPIFIQRIHPKAANPFQ